MWSTARAWVAQSWRIQATVTWSWLAQTTFTKFPEASQESTLQPWKILVHATLITEEICFYKKPKHTRAKIVGYRYKMLRP
ncbi:hypothetical protein CYLTODRAFT_122669 [Cylindrobasidium torrendii FP15055 ss-10]|uniref:Secreted protein n=1 Tax=Cylindrobasidium torrendii FP15055 ss-10 TaxID=1314674 RepID=A0A0D7BLK9_9AGAR|nr:hypothetical protein CYLTODRAFT_122669 [Cylindrobasidium torrendii FP15055 ss-10]